MGLKGLKNSLVRWLPLLLIITCCYGERIEMECGFIEKTDRGLQCEFNNIFTSNTTEVLVTESNRLIDAVSFRQSELFSVPSDIFVKFPQLKHLDVELTQMKEISGGDFYNANELKYFLARFNEIRELKSRSFVQCRQLKFIVLQYNLISNIHPDAFDGLTNLEALYLDYNKIKILPSGVLDPLVALVHFSMAYNNLTSVPGNLFARNDKLETLNLGHNQLTSFDGNQFGTLPNLEHLQLDHNSLRELDLRICKSTEINVDKNQLETLELNKWTRFISAWGNPVKKLILHEHYGTGRNYNFSFNQVNEITFFVNENCCTLENLENFYLLTQSFGDLGQKNLDVNDWNCRFLKTLQYETPNGKVMNNVCKKLSEEQPIISSSEETSATTEWHYTSPTRANSNLGNRISNPEDFIASDEIKPKSTTKPRESMEDTSTSPNIFDGMNIETLPEKRTTTEPNSFTAYIEEIFPTTEESYEKKCEKGIYKTVRTKVVGWKNKVVRKWNDWVG